MESLERKLQCFISSTYDDLQDERLSCINAILDSGHIPTGMEYFRAGKIQKEIIKKYIQESDIVFLILGGRYGTIDPETKVSYVEWEYSYSREHNKIIIPMFLEENYLFAKAADLKKANKKVSVFQNKKKNEKFHKRVKAEVGECAFIGKLDDIRNEVMRNIFQILKNDGNCVSGWIQYDPQIIIYALESDLERISKENKKKILSSLMADKIAYNGQKTHDVIQVADKLAEIIEEYNGLMNKYIHAFTRSLTITLKDEYIEVTNITNITYVTIGDIKGKAFKWNPWLYEGIESETYKFSYLYYNNEKLPLDIVKRGKIQYTQNPFYVKDVVIVNVPFDNQKNRHNFRYKTKYCVDYDRFFHEYVFSEFCNNFSLTIDLVDCRTEKANKEYMLKWAMFTPHKGKGYASKNMLDHDKNRIRFNVSDLMIPGTGYITTLSSAKPGVIKYYSIREEM